MGTLTSEVIFQLTGFGSRTDEFIQLQKGQTLAEGQVDEGFCEGICTDWARRVLGGGRAAFTQKDARLKSQTNRQATIHVNIDSMRESSNAVILVRNELIDVYEAQNSQPTCQIPLPLQTKLLNYLNFQATPDRRYATLRVSQWCNLLAEVRDQYDRKTTAGWGAFVSGMDELHRENRELQARGESHRKFSSMKIVKSAILAGTNVISNIDSMLSVQGFVAGTVLLMGFDLFAHNKDTGHAVAAFHANNGTYQFLDPNYGVYAYSQGGLRSALYYLFSNHFNQAAIYGEDGSVVTGSGDYILFGHV
jgi:hypothetical protein